MTRRSTAPLVVAIDLGSQSAKVGVYDEHGRPHATAQLPLRPYDLSDGRVTHPDDDLWSTLTAACRRALAAVPDARHRIIGVGLCTIRFCRALLDGDGRLVEPVMSWMDPRVGRPHVHDERVRYVTTSSGYLGARLTGALRDAAGNHAGLWPIDPGSWQWSTDDSVFAACGLDRTEVFELVPPGGELGVVTPDAAGETGLPTGVPVFATSNDKAVEALGSGLRDEETLLLSLGTYITSMAIAKPPAPAPEGTWRNFGSVPGEFLVESAGIRRGMWTVSWYRDLVGADETDLNAGAATVPAGSRGLCTVLDWLAPDDEPYRRGAFHGFDGSQGRYEIYRSVLEGIACTMEEARRRSEHGLGRQFRRLRVTGGGARSSLMCEILANVFELPVERVEVADAAGIGAAVCAAVGAGGHADWDAAVHAMVRPGGCVEPAPHLVEAYRGVRAAHALARERTRELAAAVASLRRTDASEPPPSSRDS